MTGTTNAEINVRDFGAKGDGVTDDTQAIIRAFTLATTRTTTLPGAGATTGVITAGTELIKGRLYFPSGNYLYKGYPLSASTIDIRGDGPHSTLITLTNQDYFLKTSSLFYLRLVDISFVGGKGTLLHYGTGQNVRLSYDIERCTFNDYSEAAIASLSSDMPAWRIRDNVFLGSNQGNSKGIVLAGLADNSDISSNEFWQDRYNIVLANYGDAYIHNNDFIHWHSHSKDTAAVWLVAYTNKHNFGGLVISQNKFGNENLSSTDFLVLIAAKEGIQDLNVATHSSTDITPKGFVAGGFTLRDNQFSSNSGYKRAAVSSYTSLVYEMNLDSRSSPDTPMFLLLGSYAYGDENFSSEVNITSSISNAASYKISPWGGAALGIIKDPMGYAEGTYGYVQSWTTGSDPSFSELTEITNIFDQMRKTPGVTILPISDSYESKGAGRVSFKSKNDSVAAYFRPTKPGKAIWIEMELRESPKDSIDKFCFRVQDSATSKVIFNRCLTLGSDWGRYRFWFVPADESPLTLLIPDQTVKLAGTSKSFDIGRIQIYQATEPVNQGRTFAQSIALESAVSPPSPLKGRVVFFIDSKDNLPKLLFPDGSIREVSLLNPSQKAASKTVRSGLPQSLK